MVEIYIIQLPGQKSFYDKRRKDHSMTKYKCHHNSSTQSILCHVVNFVLSRLFIVLKFDRSWYKKIKICCIFNILFQGKNMVGFSFKNHIQEPVRSHALQKSKMVSEKFQSVSKVWNESDREET